MNSFFRWNMFFTSFLPLWISIIVWDVWNIIDKACCFFKFKIMNAPSFFSFIREVPIEIVSIALLCTNIIVAICHINHVINLQERAIQKQACKVIRAKRANKLISEFLLAYILPMIAFNYSDIKSIVLFAIYFSVLSFLCIRNRNIYTNILLEFKRYKMYECDIDVVRMGKENRFLDCLVISKSDLTQALPHEIYFFDFENYIYIQIGDKNE